MKKVSNFMIIILIIALVVVTTLIIIRYGGNYKNGKEVSATLAILEQQLEQMDNEMPDVEYKGYQIEGIIEIPKINIKYPIINQTSEETMKLSITKFWGPQANEIGNYTLAGHNNKDGTMFGKTKYLKNRRHYKNNKLKK